MRYLLIAIVILMLTGCTKRKNAWNESFEKMRKQRIYNEEARQASENIPSINIQGKCSNNGPMKWSDIKK